MKVMLDATEISHLGMPSYVELQLIEVFSCRKLLTRRDYVLVSTRLKETEEQGTETDNMPQLLVLQPRTPGTNFDELKSGSSVWNLIRVNVLVPNNVQKPKSCRTSDYYFAGPGSIAPIGGPISDAWVNYSNAPKN